MRIIYADNYDKMSRKAAEVIAASIILKPNCVLGLATGSTPIGMYEQLIKWYRQGDLDFSNVKTVNLDEYVGLPTKHPQSYCYFMREHLFDHINIDRDNTNIPNGLAFNMGDECARYNRVIRDLGGVDVQVLGMGHNGHIGFNEPGRAFDLETHVVDLSESTIEANARFFENRAEVPRKAITMGIKSITQARQVLVIVSGEDKADIVERAFCGPVVPEIPASILQMHPNVVLIGDCAALRKLKSCRPLSVLA